MKVNEKLNAFLTKYQANSDETSIQEIVDSMLDQMEKGLKKEPSTLAMIPTYLSASQTGALNNYAIAIDAGGTNFRIGLVRFNGENIDCLDVKKMKMFGLDQPIEYADFIEQLTDLIIPYLKHTSKIGFCFSFGAGILPDKDCIVYEMSKNVEINGIKNQSLGKSIKACLKEKGIQQDVDIVILNDTVATLLGGPAIKYTKEVDGQIGLILGTGTNVAYEEKIANIASLHSDSSEKMIINTESAAFNKFTMSEFEKRVDEESSNPDHQVFEKCISGAYLGNVISQTARQGAKEGLFSADSKISSLPNFSMVEVDSFLRNPYGSNLLSDSCANDEDTEMLYQICQKAIDRASKLVCANLACCIIRMDGGKRASSPVMIVAEGSTFYKCYGYQQQIDYYMKEYVVNTLGRHYKFVSGEDVNMIGSALAVVLNS